MSPRRAARTLDPPQFRYWRRGPLLQSAAVGPVAQRLVQGTHQARCLRGETREVDGMNSGKPSGDFHPMAILSQAAGAPAEGAETT